MILDEARVQDMTRNNMKLIASISQLFLNELPDMIANIERAYNQNDCSALANAVHRLKSALGNFASKSYYDEFSQLESLALNASTEGSSLAEWFAAWTATKLKLEQMVNELKSMAGI